MRELAFTERENGFEVSLQGCAFGMFFNSLQNLFIHIGLIGFSLLRRFIFFFLGCKNIASFSFLALEKEKHVVKSTYSYEIFEKFVKSKCQHNVLKIQFTKWLWKFASSFEVFKISISKKNLYFNQLLILTRSSKIFFSSSKKYI